MSLYAELQRRKVFKVGAAYLVVAWLLIQVVATVVPQLSLPEWAPRLITLLLMVGFPVALVMAWVLDVTPEGVRVDAGRIGSKRMFAIAVLLAAGAVAWYLRNDRTAETLQVAAAPADTKPAASPPPADTPDAPVAKSIAVLAFTDLSPAKDQEYFSDGIAEEILNALVKVEDLKVAGRTSSFYYKGRNEDLREIGKALGVANVLEGSVRKQGERVRITAQLVQAEDGFHLWSETYDGELTDVFELQEKIARAITEALRVVLEGRQAQRLVPVATTNTEAYAKFLQATSIFNRRDRERMRTAIALLEEAIELDPQFARAHSRLAALSVLSPEYLAEDLDPSMEKGEALARRAIALDPTLAEPHAVIAYAESMLRRRVEGREHYERALALEPDDVLSNFWSGISLLGAGYEREGVARLDHVLEVDPMLPNGLSWRGWVHMFNGEYADARRLLERALDLGTDNAHIPLAFIEHEQGRTGEAIRRLELGLTQFGAGMPAEFPRIGAQGIFGDEAARLRAVEHVEAKLATRPAVVPGVAAWALFMLGEHARALEVIQASPTSSVFWQLGLWSPRAREARRLPQFAEFARRVGYAEQWDRYGPPDRCRKSRNGDYACD